MKLLSCYFAGNKQQNDENMNVLRLVIIALVSMSAIGAAGQKIKGSDTVLPVSQEGAETYMKLNPKARVTVTGGGSGVGISALIDGTTDIAMASRSIKFNERVKISNSGKQLREAVIAYDALAVIVNPDNPVSHLTRAQLEAIFRGKITNWKEVGGDDAQIIIVSRDTNSGTYETFNELVLHKKDVAKNAEYVGSNGHARKSISSGKYAIARPLYMFTDAYPKMGSDIYNFVTLHLSNEGREIIKDLGYIPVCE